MVWVITYAVSAVMSAIIIFTFLATCGIVSGENLREILSDVPWTRWLVIVGLIFIPIVNTAIAVLTIGTVTFNKFKNND